MILLPLILMSGMAQAQPVTFKGQPPAMGDILRLRDPFKQPDFRKYLSGGGVRTELEQFAVTEYKMLGVITGPDQMKAMLRGPNEKTYFVREGQKIGTQSGYIHRITAESVIVHERIENLLGRLETVVTEITLPAGEKVDVIGTKVAAPRTQTPGPTFEPISPVFNPPKPSEAGANQGATDFLEKLKKDIAEEVQTKLSPQEEGKNGKK